MATPLYPVTEKRINDAVEALITTQVTPWSFLNAGPPFHVKRFDGRDISYQGITFEGSPSDIFWGHYIEPFLEDLTVKETALLVQACKDREVDARKAIPELQGMLISSCHKVFLRMADIDRRLRSKGYPESVQLRPIDSELVEMTHFIHAHCEAELKMWKPRTMEIWLNNHKFADWAIKILLGVGGLLVAYCTLAKK